MVNFVVCDDNKEFLNIVVNAIDKEMMKNNTAYKCHAFSEYNADFFKLANQKKSTKIYILDIEVKNVSGIDVARKIREKDFESIIIFITSYENMGFTILKSEFMFLSFISKFDNFKEKLNGAIKKALQIFSDKKVLRFDNKGVVYTIPLTDIIYITRDSVERKSMIYTDYTTFKVNKTLMSLKNLLDERFQYSHRACIVNTKRILSVDYGKKRIVFDNGKSTELVTITFKKGVENL